MGEVDYKMILSIVSGNLAEGKPSQPPPKSPEILAAESAKQFPNQPFDAAVQNRSLFDESRKQPADLSRYSIDQPSFYSEITKETEPRTAEEKVHIFLKFTFAMESFIIDIFTTDKSLKEKEGLARFSLDGLSIKGRMLSDNSMVVSLLLVNCLLDDTRKGREDKLNRLIERSGNSQDSSGADPKCVKRSMIDITFQQSQTDAFGELF